MTIIVLNWQLFSAPAQRYFLRTRELNGANTFAQQARFSGYLQSWLSLKLNEAGSMLPDVVATPISSSWANPTALGGGRAARAFIEVATWRHTFWQQQEQTPHGTVMYTPHKWLTSAIDNGTGDNKFGRLQGPNSAVTALRSARWFKLQFFVLLLNSGWHLVASNYKGAVGSHRPLLGVRVGGRTGVVPYAVNALWARWNNAFFFLLNLFFYRVPVFGFGQLSQKYLIDAINWASWSDASALWKYTHLFFYFKYSCRTGGALDTFAQMKSQMSGLAFVVNVDYHYHTLKLLELSNIPSMGLCDITTEPWLCWYPLFGHGSDRFLQHLFLLCVIRIKANGVQARVDLTRTYLRYFLLAEACTGYAAALIW